MAHEAVRSRFDERRRGLLACTLNSSLGCMSHCQHVHAVDVFRFEFISARFLRNVLQRHGALERSAHAVFVVFANVDAGQLPKLRHIQRLVESTLVHGSFAKEADGYLIGLFVLAGKSDASRQRNLSTDNCVAAEKIQLRIKEVH